jgi:peptidoglycan/xylan/chitin deacetylase (PgdA/CDA1 family)
MRISTLVWILLHWSGVLWAWRWYHRSEVTILMLHGVMDTTQASAWEPLRPQLSRNSLESALRILSKYYEFVSLCDAVEMLAGQRPLRPYSVVLTFDDGYRNNLTHALPILQKYGAPATFFIVPGHIEKRTPFWFDRLDYALQSVDVDGRDVPIGNTTVRFRGKNRSLLRESYRELRETAKALVQDLEMQREIDTFSQALERESGRKLVDINENDDWSALLSWPDVRTALAQSVTIGSHTVDHIRIGFVTSDMAKHQLQHSKEMIEAQIGKACQFFCYPNGSVTESVVALVQECGFKAAVTTEEGTNRVGENLMLLRRLSFPETGDRIETLIHVSGLSLVASRLKERLRTVLSHAKLTV